MKIVMDPETGENVEALNEFEALEKLGIRSRTTLSTYRKRGDISFMWIAGEVHYLPRHLREYLSRQEVKANE